MALWQFALDVIPSSKASIDGLTAIHLTRDQVDEITLDLLPQDQQRLFESLEKILPEKTPWNGEMRIWGDETTNDIQVYFEGPEIEFVQIRLDVSNLSMDIIGGVCNVARQFGWVFVSRHGAVIQPSRESVVRSITQSDASKFVDDSMGYIERALREDSDRAK